MYLIERPRPNYGSSLFNYNYITAIDYNYNEILKAIIEGDYCHYALGFLRCAETI